MVDRMILFAGISTLLLGSYFLLRWVQVQHAARVAKRDPLLGDLRLGTPAIVYFTSPACAPCRTQQEPALKALQAELGDTVQVVEVNALEQPDAANRWGVLSVPTTFVLDRQGTPRDVNYGVTGTTKLKQQLQRAG